jgi:hypothetical protein
MSIRFYTSRPPSKSSSWYVTAVEGARAFTVELIAVPGDTIDDKLLHKTEYLLGKKLEIMEPNEQFDIRDEIQP